MPGTIQVSVLLHHSPGFHGASITITAFTNIHKGFHGKKRVSNMGQRGLLFGFTYIPKLCVEFLHSPLTSLRDNLIVTLQDHEGNEISHAGVETRLVIEKGVWDDVFLLEGGGYVHMKLQFVLSQEDRQRIRIMRESALRKKHDELLNSELKCPEFLTNVGSKIVSSFQPNQDVSVPQKSIHQSEVVATQAGPTLTSPSILFENGKSDHDDGEGTSFVHKQKQGPNDTDTYEDTSSTTSLLQGYTVHVKEVSHKSLVEKSEFGASPIDFPARIISLEEASSFKSSGSAGAAKTLFPIKSNRERADDGEKQSPLEKTTGSVRNMISAFESSLNEDMRPSIRPTPAKSHSSMTGVEVPLKKLQLNDVKTENYEPAQSPPGRVRNPLYKSDNQQALAHIRKRERQIGLVGELTGATSSQATGKLEELRAARVRAKGTNVDLMNKLKLKQNEKEVETKAGKTSSGDLARASTCERASASGRILNEHFSRQLFGNLFARKRHSGGNLLRNNGKGTQPSGSQEVKIEVALRDEHYSSECYGAWIFPDEGKCLCMTTASKQMMNVMESCRAEAKTQTRKMSSSIAGNVKECGLHSGTGIEVKEGEKTSKRLRKSEVETSTDAETSRGPIGQVMRVAIMVGFATLVLLTREKTR